MWGIKFYVHTKTFKIIVLYTYIFPSLIADWKTKDSTLHARKHSLNIICCSFHLLTVYHHVASRVAEELFCCRIIPPLKIWLHIDDIHCKEQPISSVVFLILRDCENWRPGGWGGELSEWPWQDKMSISVHQSWTRLIQFTCCVCVAWSGFWSLM
jgi:hypothetical protein